MARFAFLTFYDTVSIGMRYLSSILKKEGHEVRLIFFKEMSSKRVEKDDAGIMYTVYQRPGVFGCAYDVNPPTEKEISLLKEIVAEINPDVLGISTRSFWLDMGRDIIKTLKNNNQKMITIAGGFGPTLQSNEFAKGFDYICYGEGDEVIKNIGRVVDSGETEKIRELKNIGFMGEDGRLVLNQPEEPLRDLDKLPYPDLAIEDHYLIEDNGLKKGAASTQRWYNVLATRGCPFSCSYCMAGQWNKLYKDVSGISFPKVRRRSPANVVGEIKKAVKIYPPREGVPCNIEFIDSCFPPQEEWLEEFCKLYKDEVNLPFACNIDPRYHSLSRNGKDL